MTINTSGKWWIGSEAADIADYLKAYKAEGYEVQETRICKCNCGSSAFELAPEWSPNGKYLVSVNDNSDLCRPFDYLIILSATDPPTLELKHHLEGYENWTIAGWDGDDSIKLQVHVFEPEGTYDQDVEAVRFGNGRKLVWGKKSNVVPHEPGSQWTPPDTPPVAPGTNDR